MARLDDLMREARSLPPERPEELIEFARFLGMKSAERRVGTAILSEPILGEDWLTPEEDAAWQDL